MVKKIIPVLTAGGICLQYEYRHIKYINKIKELFTIQTLGFNNSLKIARGYKLYPEKRIIILPKFGVHECLKDPERCCTFNKLGIYNRSDIVNTVIQPKKFKYLQPNKTLKWKGKLNNYQQVVLKKVSKRYFSDTRVKKGKAGVILGLPTGHGKTFVSMAIINKLKLPTLIVCTRKKIADQWFGLLVQLFPRAKIGLYHSDNRMDGDIIVGVIDSLANSNKFTLSVPTRSPLENQAKRIVREKGPKTKREEKTLLKKGSQKGEKKKGKGKKEYNVKEFYKRWDLIIFDECHNYCTTKNSKIFRRIRARYTLGLSATPDDRSDNFDMITQWNIGPVIFPDDISGYMEKYEEEESVPVFTGEILGVKYHAPIEFSKNIVNKNGMVIPHEMLEQITNDPYRIKLILKQIMQLLVDSYCILVFSDRISYLRQIKEKLDERKEPGSIILDDLGNDVHQIITGGASDSEMVRAYENSNIILTTFAFFMEGISIPKINSIIYATPRKSRIEQANGRCLRPSNAKNKSQRNDENNKKRIIVDIIDWECNIYKRQWYIRKGVYKNMDKIGAKFEIKQIDIQYEYFLEKST